MFALFSRLIHLKCFFYWVFFNKSGRGKWHGKAAAAAITTWQSLKSFVLQQPWNIKTPPDSVMLQPCAKQIGICGMFNASGGDSESSHSLDLLCLNDRITQSWQKSHSFCSLHCEHELCAWMDRFSHFKITTKKKKKSENILAETHASFNRKHSPEAAGKTRTVTLCAPVFKVCA